VPALGQYYNRARYLDVERGRFWSRDVFETTFSRNLYRYADSDPVNRNDPSGLFTYAEILAVVAFNPTMLGLAAYAPVASKAKDAAYNVAFYSLAQQIYYLALASDDDDEYSSWLIANVQEAESIKDNIDAGERYYQTAVLIVNLVTNGTGLAIGGYYLVKNRVALWSMLKSVWRKVASYFSRKGGQGANIAASAVENKTAIIGILDRNRTVIREDILSTSPGGHRDLIAADELVGGETGYAMFYKDGRWKLRGSGFVPGGGINPSVKDSLAFHYGIPPDQIDIL
jgi:hypothetical protein